MFIVKVIHPPIRFTKDIYSYIYRGKEDSTRFSVSCLIKDAYIFLYMADIDIAMKDVSKYLMYENVGTADEITFQILSHIIL